MLLLRGGTQQREMSIRMAMGAGRGCIVRQLLTESLVLSSAGGVVGCLAAIWLLDVVIPAVRATRVDPATVLRYQ